MLLPPLAENVKDEVAVKRKIQRPCQETSFIRLIRSPLQTCLSQKENVAFFLVTLL
jgi:hypothetical protein